MIRGFENNALESQMNSKIGQRHDVFFRPSAGPFENPLQLSGGNCSEIHVKSLFLRVAVWLVLIPSKWDDGGVYIV